MLIDGKRKALVIDDDENFIPAFISFMREAYDHEVEFIHNSLFNPTDSDFDDFEDHVMSLIAEHKSELGAVFLDLGLVSDLSDGTQCDRPWDYGFRLEREIRDKFFDIPLLALTNYKELQNEAYFHEFDAFIHKADTSKAVKKSEIVGDISRAVEKRKLVVRTLEKRYLQIKRRQIIKGKRLRFLHVSDLHLGMNGSGCLWPTVENLVLDDLSLLVHDDGPIPLVIFTGDFAFAGRKQEFELAQKAIEKIRKRLEVDDPIVIGVPGNHDLSRPGPADALLVKSLGEPGELRDEFWRKKTSKPRKAVSKMFADYSKWIGAHGVPGSTHGVLPGDFILSIDLAGVKVGIVGLNITFAQVERGDCKGRLLYDHRQIQCAFDKLDTSVGDWSNTHDFTLLLTHQPIDWLSPASIKELESELLSPGQFLLHLHGHMHEPNFFSLGRGASRLRHSVQCPSLFGLEHWGEEKEQRIHGYNVVEVECSAEGRQFRIWPRIENEIATGRRLVADNRHYLFERFTEATAPSHMLPNPS